MESLTEKVVEGSFWAGMASVISRFGALIFSILLARFLLPELFGLYSLTMSIALLFMIVCDLGINETLIRYVAFYKKKEKIAAYSGYLLKVKFYFSLVFSFILLAGAYPLAVFVFRKPELFFPLILSSLFVLSSSVVSFYSSLLYAVKKTKYIFLKEVILQILQISSVVFIFLFFSYSAYVPAVIIAAILVNLVILMFLRRSVVKTVPYAFKPTDEKIDNKDLFKFLAYASIISVSGLLFTYADTIILGFFVSFAYIGYYKVAFGLIFGIIGLFSYLGTVILPIFTRLKNQRAERAINKVLRIVMIFAIPTAFGLIILGRYFIKLLYGDAYLAAAPVFNILAVLLMVYLPSTLILTVFFSMGKAKKAAQINLLSLALAVALELIFLLVFAGYSEALSLTGIAAIVVFSRAVTLFYTFFLVKKETGIRINLKQFAKPFISALVMALVLYSMNHYVIKDMSLFWGIAEIIIGMIVYALVMTLMRGITKEDFKLIRMIPLKKDVISFFKKKDE